MRSPAGAHATGPPGARAPNRPALLSRRTITGALGAALLVSGCGALGSGSTTSSDVGLDPLADLDTDLWIEGSAATLADIPVADPEVDLDAWADAGITTSVIADARAVLEGFLVAAYLQPEVLRGQDDATVKQNLLKAVPEVWRETLPDVWDGGSRHFYTTQFAEPFRLVGAPHLVADWYAAERHGVRHLQVGGTIAYSVLDTSAHDVGVYAVRFGTVAQLDADAVIASALHRVSVHGLDMCATEDAGYRQVLALDGSEEHRAVRSAVMDQVIASPAISEPDLADENSDVFDGLPETNIFC